ncbi:MAG: hypothetical protein JW963_12080 [Anaerolineales bacterium]|nr:hypothetical protein [Anaerolineales bacterium]
MKREFLPYYISRLILSLAFSILVLGFHWKALILALVFFGLFLLYLHSGWFHVDLTNPFLPLRRDSRGELIQRKALILAIIVGFSLYLLSGALGFVLISGNLAISVAIVTYFASQFVLFFKA